MNILLIGSVGLEDAETVFRTLARTVGSAAPRYPDGETGERYYWVIWQGKVFESHPDFEFVESRAPLNPGSKAPKQFRLRDGVDAMDIQFPPVGYAEEALASYKIFKRLKDEGTVPADVRFQVSLPTPVAVISTFVMREERVAIEPAYHRAIEREVDTIVASIPNDELAIQWDICHEVVAQDGGFPLHYDDVLENTTSRVCPLIDRIPTPVQVGIHLCYGDPGHKHIIEPEDLSTSVAFANAISGGVQRSIEWIHMPIPRARSDKQYFEPLSNLALQPNTELYLGLVHFTDGVEGARARIATAQKFTDHFGIATECGFGRRDPATIPDLLTLHASISAL